MSQIPPDILEKFSALQPQVWQTVSLTASEAIGKTLNFGDALTVATPTSDLYAEMTSPKLVVQFSFSHMPENAQVVLLPQETFAVLAHAIREEPVESIDENLVADVRPAIEGIVQGICLSVGNIRNEAVVASGLSIRFQVFSFPPNLQKVAEVVRTNVAISGDAEVNGTAIWMMDSETAHAILGIQVEEDDASPFATLSEGPAIGPSGATPDEVSGLEIVMDIPLELSVELGRVRMMVKDVVELGAGSIVEIDKAAGEPVDVLVNQRLVARGEVVVIEDSFGVRITEILSPQERIARLNEVA